MQVWRSHRLPLILPSTSERLDEALIDLCTSRLMCCQRLTSWKRKCPPTPHPLRAAGQKYSSNWSTLTLTFGPHTHPSLRLSPLSLSLCLVVCRPAIPAATGCPIQLAHNSAALMETPFHCTNVNLQFVHLVACWALKKELDIQNNNKYKKHKQ